MTRRIPHAVALTVAAALLLPAVAHADGTAAPVKLTEKQLRAFETRLLGAQHAAEHARLRQWSAARPPSSAATSAGCARCRSPCAGPSSARSACAGSARTRRSAPTSRRSTRASTPPSRASGPLRRAAARDQRRPRDRHQRRDDAHRQGPLYLLPDEPQPDLRRSLGNDEPQRGHHVVWDPRQGHKPQRFASSAADPARDRQAGQHLVQRHQLQLRRHGARHGRQPRLPPRLEGPGHRLHVQPVHRAVALRGPDGQRPLVPDTDPAARRPHGDHVRLRQVGHAGLQQRHRGLRPGAPRGQPHLQGRHPGAQRRRRRAPDRRPVPAQLPHAQRQRAASPARS